VPLPAREIIQFRCANWTEDKQGCTGIKPALSSDEGETAIQ
jgi:hypothetical protein